MSYISPDLWLGSQTPTFSEILEIRRINALKSGVSVDSLCCTLPVNLNVGDLISTVQGLGSDSYISSHTLQISLTSSIQGLGSAGYVSSLSLASTIQGLGSSS